MTFRVVRSLIAIPLLAFSAAACPPGEGTGTEAAGKDTVLPYWEIFADEGRVFEPNLADPREAQVRVGYLRDRYIAFHRFEARPGHRSEEQNSKKSRVAHWLSGQTLPEQTS